MYTPWIVAARRLEVPFNNHGLDPVFRRSAAEAFNSTMDTDAVIWEVIMSDVVIDAALVDQLLPVVPFGMKTVSS